ncbi:uncharacterized protein [Triticum aestivum]|uniref:uncharacterized protein isoform X3 n=1 Tax=Triticum aestivum TaxID=4565 RepID=UPI001D01E96C|nr:uncharacterized protein LOC123114170 isoform X3 [Triticum aestivum]
MTHPDYFNDEVQRVWASLTEDQLALPEYAAGNQEAWAAYFGQRSSGAGHQEQRRPPPVVGRPRPHAPCRPPAPRGRQRAAVEVPCRPGPPPERRPMDAEEDRLLFLLPFLPLLALLWVAGALQRQCQPAETPLGQRTRSAGIVINEGGRTSSSAPPRLVKPKTEPGLAAMKTEPGLAGVKTEPGLDDAAAMKWAREDWAWLELERQCRALEEIAARRRGRDEGGVVVLDDSDDDALPPVRHGDPGQGSSSGIRVKEEKDDDDGDATVFSEFFGL